MHEQTRPYNRHKLIFFKHSENERKRKREAQRRWRANKRRKDRLKEIDNYGKLKENEHG